MITLTGEKSILTLEIDEGFVTLLQLIEGATRKLGEAPLTEVEIIGYTEFLLRNGFWTDSFKDLNETESEMYQELRLSYELMKFN